MFEDFQCRCIYVEISNDTVPQSGSLEFRAKSCEVCRARGALFHTTNGARIAFHTQALRYNRTH